MAASSPLRDSSFIRRSRPWLIAVALAGAGLLGWQAFRPKPAPVPQTPLVTDVTGLGRLTPEGGLVNLSIPAGNVGGSEVVESWFASEGDPIRKDQILVRLSSWQQLQASVAEAKAKLRASEALLPSLVFSQERARELFRDGGISEQELGEVQANVISKLSEIESGKATVAKAQTQLAAAEVRSPMNGSLIQIFSWPGMKETDQGLALLGRTDRMQVWAQIFQTDVNRIQVGENAVVTAESGGFQGSINARLASIISQVSQRDLFAISGNNDVNARVVLVKLDLDADARRKVERLSGLNVIVRFPRP